MKHGGMSPTKQHSQVAECLLWKLKPTELIWLDATSKSNDDQRHDDLRSYWLVIQVRILS